MAKSLNSKPTANARVDGISGKSVTSAKKDVTKYIQILSEKDNASAIEGFVTILKDLVEPFAIISDDVVKKNIDLACGNGMSEDDRTISFECAEYLMSNFAYILMGLIVDQNFKETFLESLRMEIELDSLSPETVKTVRADMTDPKEYDSVGSIVIGVSGFSTEIGSRFMDKMARGYDELDRWADEFDSAVEKLSTDEKLEYGFIFSNFMYLIRAFTHNDLFMSYVITVIEKVKSVIK